MHAPRRHHHHYHSRRRDTAAHTDAVDDAADAAGAADVGVGAAVDVRAGVVPQQGHTRLPRVRRCLTSCTVGLRMPASEDGDEEEEEEDEDRCCAEAEADAGAGADVECEKACVEVDRTHQVDIHREIRDGHGEEPSRDVAAVAVVVVLPMLLLTLEAAHGVVSADSAQSCVAVVLVASLAPLRGSLLDCQPRQRRMEYPVSMNKLRSSQSKRRQENLHPPQLPQHTPSCSCQSSRPG